MEVVVEVRERVQNRAAQQSAARPGPDADPAQRRGRDGSCMTFSGVAANLPGDARAAGLIVALSTLLDCAVYMERSCDYVNEGDPTDLRNDVSCYSWRRTCRRWMGMQ